MPESMYLTREGLEKLKAELEHLRTVRRPEVAGRIHESRERGGTVGNAEYEDAKNELAFTEGRILTLDNLINNAIIIEEGQSSGDTVEIGSRVTVKNQDGKTSDYTITGSAEADPARGKISNVSPIGKALLGKKVGEVTEVNVPSGKIKVEIVSIA
jgi:transcription elongation factor GreA